MIPNKVAFINIMYNYIRNDTFGKMDLPEQDNVSSIAGNIILMAGILKIIVLFMRRRSIKKFDTKIRIMFKLDKCIIFIMEKHKANLTLRCYGNNTKL